jgi:hypothetical protein
LTLFATKSMLKNGRGEGLRKPEQGYYPAPVYRGGYSLFSRAKEYTIPAMSFSVRFKVYIGINLCFNTLKVTS